MVTAPSQAPLSEMSGTPRAAPVTRATPAWYHGRLKNSDTPPPVAKGLGPLVPVNACCSGTSKVSFHATDENVPSEPSLSCVPPTAVTSGSVDGQPVVGLV